MSASRNKVATIIRKHICITPQSMVNHERRGGGSWGSVTVRLVALGDASAAVSALHCAVVAATSSLATGSTRLLASMTCIHVGPILAAWAVINAHHLLCC